MAWMSLLPASVGFAPWASPRATSSTPWAAPRWSSVAPSSSWPTSVALSTLAWAAPRGKQSRQPQFGDAAINACQTINVLLNMAFRPTTGFIKSLLQLVDLNWTVPNFSTFSRRPSSFAGKSHYCARSGYYTALRVPGTGPIK